MISKPRSVLELKINKNVIQKNGGKIHRIICKERKNHIKKTLVTTNLPDGRAERH